MGNLEASGLGRAGMEVFPGFEAKQIPPPQKMFLQTHLPLPIHESQSHPSSNIPPSRSPLPSAELESLGDDQIENEDALEAKTDVKTGGRVR